MNDDVKKLISSVRDQTNQLKRVVNENLNTSSRQQPDRSPTLKSSKSNNSLLKREASDPPKYDGSFTTNTAGKTNKSKLADLLGYKKEQNFSSAISDEAHRGSSNRFSENNFVHDDEEDDDNNNQLLSMQNKKGYGTRTNLSAIDSDKTGYMQGYEQPRNAKSHRNQGDLSQICLVFQKENEALRGTVADYKRAFEHLIKKHKELKKVIEKLSAKEDEVIELNKALQQERQRNNFLRNRNAILREKFIKFVENVRKSSTEDYEGEQEEDAFYHSIATQNAKLREIMNLGKISDPSAENQLLQTEQTLNSEEHSHTNSKWRPHPNHIETGGLHKDLKHDHQQTKDLIEDFKKEKFQKLSSKKSLSTESDQSSVDSNESYEAIVGNDNTPILQNRHSLMSNSSDTASSTESNRINFVSRPNPSIFATQSGGTVPGNSLNNLFKASSKTNSES